MKKAFLLLAVILLASFLGGCGPNAQDITEQYKAYAAVDNASNKAGISISKVEIIGNSYIISVLASHPALRQSEENAGVLAGRLSVVSAENTADEVEHKLASVNSTTTKADGTKTQAFYPAINISKDTKAKYIIIYFEGINKDESLELETPPLFFIVELDKKEPKILTTTPLLASGLFD